MKTNKKLLTSLISISMCSMLIPMNGIQNIYATEGEVTLANTGNISKDEIINALIPDSQLEHKVDDNEKVEIPDYNLRRGICELMNYKDVDNAVITKRDLRRIRYLSPEVCQAHDNSEHGVRVKSLEGLQYAENLEKLSMVNQEFGDISPLANLTKLKYLDLRNVAKNGHGIKDLSPLAKLTNLEYLNLFKAEPINVNELENLVKLKSLNLGAAKINSVSFASKMINLEYLNLEHNEFADVTALEDLVNLKTLLLDSTVKTWITDTSKSRIKDISKLNRLTKLEELGVSNNDIDNIDVVKNFKKLNKFHATNNNITNFESLLSLRGLQEVWIQENKNNIVKSPENYLKAKELFNKLNKGIYGKEDVATIDSLLNADSNVKKFFSEVAVKTLEKYKEELQAKDNVENTLFEDIRLNQINGSIEKIAKLADVKIKAGENLLDKLPKNVKVRVKLDKKDSKGEISRNSNSDILRIAVVSSEEASVVEGIELVSSTGKKYTVANGIIEVKASDAVVPYVPYSLNYNGKKVFEFYNTGYNRVGNIKGSNGAIDVVKADDISKYLVANIDKGLAENNNSTTVKPGTETGINPPVPKTETEAGTNPSAPKTGADNKKNQPLDTTGLGIVDNQIIYKVIDENGKAVELDAPLVASGEYDSKQSIFENGLYKFKSVGEDSEFRISLNSSKYQLVGSYSFTTVYNRKLPNANSFSYISKDNIKENFSKEGKITNKEIFVIQVKNLKDNAVTTPKIESPTDNTKPVKPEVHTDSRIGVKKDARNNVSINYKIVDQNGKELTEALSLSVTSPNNQDILLKFNNGVYTYKAQGIDDTFTLTLKSDKYDLVNSYRFRDKFNVKTFKGEISSVQVNSEDASNVEEAGEKFFTLVVSEKKSPAVSSNNVTFRAVGNSGSTDTIDVTLPVEYDLTNVDVNTPGEYEVTGKVVHGENIRNDKDLKVNVKVIVTAKDTDKPEDKKPETEVEKPKEEKPKTEVEKPKEEKPKAEVVKPDNKVEVLESSKPDTAPINDVPELGNVDKLKIEAEISKIKEQLKTLSPADVEKLTADLEKLEEALKILEANKPAVQSLPKLDIPTVETEISKVKEQIKDAEENGAEPYLVEGLKALLADHEELLEALKVLEANKPAINEVPQFDLTALKGDKLTRSDVHFKQNDFEQKDEIKKGGGLPATGMTSSRTAVLGLSLIALVGVVVRRKLSK
ncbi:hypothetical protein [uncultured Gemella sp.]|uniref:hypothetical protein n=1 Tax=uncultured Gemella sp. TaxID=254352 RepID=UPI0028D430C1|nr:hypothetical protein [uncultured Gemella sp.]